MADKDKEPLEQPPEAYEPPRVVSEETFEQLSLSCGKVNPGTFGCGPPLGSVQNS
jgi:hypothetical protein